MTEPPPSEHPGDEPPPVAGADHRAPGPPMQNGLGLTREGLSTLPEADLRTRVLVPLFRAMEFRDVDHYHGGAMEQGKDLVMWQPDPLGTRVNYAVVAKAGKVSGKAYGGGSAGEVVMQVQQALADPFRDARTGALEHVASCYVVASGAIPKEARQAVRNGLGPGVSPSAVRFVDGDQLWTLVEEHLPAATALEKLADLQRVLAANSPQHDIVLQASRDGVQIIVGPAPDAAPTLVGTTPGTPPVTGSARGNAPGTPAGRVAGTADERTGRVGEAPENVPPGDTSVGDGLRIAFSDSPAGRAAAARLATDLPSGLAVTIEGSAVQEVRWPAPVAPLLGPGTVLRTLTFQPPPHAAAVDPVPRPLSLLATIEVVARSGPVTGLGPVLFEAGPPEAVAALATGAAAGPVTFASADPFLPWKVALTLDPPGPAAPGLGQVHLQFTPAYAGANAKLAVDALRFHGALHAGGVLRVRDARTGLPLFTAEAPPGALAATPPAPALLQYADALARIQARLERWVEMPAAGPISEDAVLFALETAEIVEAGEATRPFGTATLQVDRQAAVRVLEAFADGAAHDLTNAGNETRTVGGVAIPLGRVAVVLPQARVTGEEWAALRDRVAATSEADFVPVTFTASPTGDPARMYYRDWIRPERVPAGISTIFAAAAPSDSSGRTPDSEVPGPEVPRADT